MPTARSTGLVNLSKDLTMTDRPDTETSTAFPQQAGRSVIRPLPDALRLGPVRLQVRDLPTSLDYYTTVLGLRPRRTSDTTAALHASDDAEPLVELVEQPDTAPLRANSRLGLYHFALLLPDRPALGRFLAHLARTGTRLGSSDHLVSEALYLHDPDGLGIEVYADRPRSEWRQVGGQLVMATQPLDSASVLAAAGGESWTGMPSGTTMGHVHLHVGDVDTASRFYHEALGLDRTVWSYPGALFLSAGGYHHHLGLNTWARNATPASEHDARLLEWRIILPTVDDARAAAARIASAGHEVEESDGSWRTSDPWGTTLRLTTS
jgi:catechol 2,3-dioxygenase